MANNKPLIRGLKDWYNRCNKCCIYCDYCSKGCKDACFKNYVYCEVCEYGKQKEKTKNCDK